MATFTQEISSIPLMNALYILTLTIVISVQNEKRSMNKNLPSLYKTLSFQLMLEGITSHLFREHVDSLS